eukprot:GHVT01012882.1.p1 GENE.GHVT01012882.1~~GHVT01012882.1.p1  ORF type:complete len:426 (+),score=88.75 GHVT01012882.1:4688-5965(+)
MANSQYEFIRLYESDSTVSPGSWFVVRVDGHRFAAFTKTHNYQKPTDVDGTKLMNYCALQLMKDMPDIVLAFGQSDEYSFLFRQTTSLWNRRREKIVTHISSHFSASFVFNWHSVFPNKPLAYPPKFDGKLICYPTNEDVKDYFKWRQADCHVNALYNECFWALVIRGGKTEEEAHQTLKDTTASTKNEMLFSRFNLNYSALPAIVRKGTIIIRDSTHPAKQPTGHNPTDRRTLEHSCSERDREPIGQWAKESASQRCMSLTSQGELVTQSSSSCCSSSSVSSSASSSSSLSSPFSSFSSCQSSSSCGSCGCCPCSSISGVCGVGLSPDLDFSAGGSRLRLRHCDVIREDFWGCECSQLLQAPTRRQRAIAAAAGAQANSKKVQKVAAAHRAEPADGGPREDFQGAPAQPPQPEKSTDETRHATA